MRHQPTIFKVPVDVFMRMYHENLFLKANVSQWLFDGIDDPILDIAQRFPDLPINIPYDKFGWFYTVSLLFCFYFIFLLNSIVFLSIRILRD